MRRGEKHLGAGTLLLHAADALHYLLLRVMGLRRDLPAVAAASAPAAAAPSHALTCQHAALGWGVRGRAAKQVMRMHKFMRKSVAACRASRTLHALLPVVMQCLRRVPARPLTASSGAPRTSTARLKPLQAIRVPTTQSRESLELRGTSSSRGNIGRPAIYAMAVGVRVAGASIAPAHARTCGREKRWRRGDLCPSKTNLQQRASASLLSCCRACSSSTSVACSAQSHPMRGGGEGGMRGWERQGVHAKGQLEAAHQLGIRRSHGYIVLLGAFAVCHGGRSQGSLVLCPPSSVAMESGSDQDSD